jgi:O-antigen/teichoic acid export membrane protein
MTKTLQKVLAFLQRPAFREGGLVLLDQGFLSLVTFATGAMLARATDKDQYSVYVLAISLILFLQGFPRALVNVPFTIYAPGLSDNDRKIYQGSALFHVLMLCVLVTVGMFTVYLLNGIDIEQGFAGMSAALPLLALVTSSLFLREFTRNALLARLQIRAGVAANILATIGQLVLTTWLFALHRLTIEYVFLVTALTSFTAALYMLWSQRAQMQVVRSRLWVDFLRGLRTGRWILIEVFAYLGASQVYPWLLLYLLDPRSVAIFGVCSAFAGLVGPFLRGASGYIHPRMVHGYKNSNAKTLVRLLWLSVLVLSIPYGAWLVFGGVFAEDLVTLIYGKGYSGYAGLTLLLLARAMVEGVSSPVAQALQTMERADVVTLSLIFGTMITLGLGPPLIAHMGLIGAGVAAVASSAVSAFWRSIVLRKIVRHESP